MPVRPSKIGAKYCQDCLHLEYSCKCLGRKFPISYDEKLTMQETVRKNSQEKLRLQLR